MAIRQDVVIENLTKAGDLTLHHILQHKPLEALVKGFVISMVGLQELVDRTPNVWQRKQALDNIYQDFPGLREYIVAVAREGNDEKAN